MTAIQVTHEANSCYRVAVGRHVLTVDQPEDAGGDDLGPTAVQLFAASLVACTAHYAGSYLARHGLSSEGMVVEGEHVVADRPARLGSMSVTITPPVGMPEHRKASLLRRSVPLHVAQLVPESMDVESRSRTHRSPRLWRGSPLFGSL